MLKPLTVAIGLRYLGSRSRGFFVSFISWVSLVGVALGVAALITVLSVMNGFEGELRTRLLALTAHGTLSAPTGGIDDWRSVATRAAAVPGVLGVAPSRELQVLLGDGTALSGATLRGIDVAAEAAISNLAPAMIAGSLDSLVPGSDRVVLGRVLAWQLEADVGDRLTVLLPRTDSSGDLVPRIVSLEVSGIFEVGLQDHDSVLALAALDDVNALAMATAPASLRLRYDDALAAPERTAALAATLDAGLVVNDWTREHAAYFRAIRIEKAMMTLILLLIVGVAAFNIVASLVMVVGEKRTDIAILRTLGLEPRRVLAVFMVQGTVIGWAGVAIGVAAGLALAFNVGTVVPVLERLFGFELFAADVYYITEVPSEVHAADVAWIAAGALFVTWAATIYPALKAARTPPAEALRYE